MKYRIVETEEEGRWIGWGVAYQDHEEDKVFLFVPAWRSAKMLPVRSLQELEEGHLLHSQPSSRWCNVEAWEEDCSFLPIEVLLLHNSLPHESIVQRVDLPYRMEDRTTEEKSDRLAVYQSYNPTDLTKESHTMQTEQQTDMDYAVAHQRRESGSRRQRTPVNLIIMAIIAVLGATIAVGAILFLFYRMANPTVSPGKGVYTREIILILDPTGSMETNLPQMKQIVKERIFPNLGPGDQLTAYRIGPSFSETQYRILGEEWLPAAGENMLDTKRCHRIPAEAYTEVWSKVQDVILHSWTPKLEALSTEKDAQGHDVLWSDYLGTMKYLAARLQQQQAGSPKEKVIIVIGDLGDQYKSDLGDPPAPSPDEGQAFSGITVKMIYPYQSEREKDFRPEYVQKYWEEYFAKRGNEQVKIAAFDDPSPLLAPSAVPKSPNKE